MATVREATTKVIELAGFRILTEPHKFVASMLDLLDYRMVERDVLVEYCDEQFLSPLVRAADLGMAPEFEAAYASGVWYLHNDNRVSLKVAQPLVYGLVMGVADARGVYVSLQDPELSKGISAQSQSESPWTSAHPPVSPGADYNNGGYAYDYNAPPIQPTPPNVPQTQPPVAKRTNTVLLVVVVMLLGAVAAVGAFVLMPQLMQNGGESQTGSFTYTGTNGNGTSVEVIPDDDEPVTQDEQSVVQDEGPAVRDSLSAYSWAELGEISELMQDAGNRYAALDIAEQYNLVKDGKFVATTKEVKLNDGTTLNMRLVDIMHDDLASGSGQASMTFLAANVSHHGRMASATTTDGGWQSSEMRSWMSSTLYDTIPSEVRGLIVPVSKYSNNIGKTRSTSCVTATSDNVWLPSIVELCGPVNWSYSSDESNSAYYNSVFNAEGSQFAYFSQQVIQKADENNHNDCLALGEIWWMRSTAASRGRGRYVSSAGDPSQYGNSNDSHGVVVGFCI